MTDWLPWAGLLGGIVAVGQLLWGIWKDQRGGALRKGQAEAAKASLDVAQAELSLPHVQESLKLGNLAEAVTIQQQIINGLREHAAWQDDQIKGRDSRITELEERLAARDEKVAALEERLNQAEEALNTARRIIDELRETSRSELREGPGAV